MSIEDKLTIEIEKTAVTPVRRKIPYAHKKFLNRLYGAIGPVEPVSTESSVTLHKDDALYLICIGFTVGGLILGLILGFSLV
jgi:hypothetical protein